MNLANYISEIERASKSMRDIYSESMAENRVPSCPDWNFKQLMLHLADVQSHWAKTILNPDATDEMDFINQTPDRDINEWCELKTKELIDAINSVSPDKPCATWWTSPKTAEAIARHQAQEACVHAWDAHLAIGKDLALPQAVALDGISEWINVHNEWTESKDFTIVFAPTDSTETITWDRGGVSVTLSATASDLNLFLNGRRPLSALSLTGDAAVIAPFLAELPAHNN
ncbi:MAG: hypothetical protein RL228_750 [Actinomycetota bacterium]|jgi:uncharacterized protein (TIGR03083 family)